MFDNLEEIQKEFPQAEWGWYGVSSENEARRVILSLAFLSAIPTFGEVRWFDNKNGVVLIRKNNLKPDQSALADVDHLLKKKPWYKRLFGIK